MLDTMKDLVKEKDICVLATVSDNQPHCSLMAYVAADTGLEIYMATKRNTKKYQNLLDNPNVSVLIDTRDEDQYGGRSRTKALTITGTFESINDVSKKKSVRSGLLKKHPRFTDFLSDPGVEIFLIKVKSFMLLIGVTAAYFEKVE